MSGRGLVLLAFNGPMRHRVKAFICLLAAIGVAIVVALTRGKFPYDSLTGMVWGFGAVCCLVAAFMNARIAREAPHVELSVSDDRLRLIESARTIFDVSLREVREIRLSARCDERPAPEDASEADLVLVDQRIVPIPVMVVRRFHRARSAAERAGIDLRFVIGPPRK